MTKRAILIGLCLCLIALASLQAIPANAQTGASTDNACAAALKSKVTLRFAQAFKVAAQEIADWRCKEHKGFGEISLAYALASLTQTSGHTALTVTQIFAQRADHLGWGKIVKGAGFTMREVRQELARLLRGTRGKGKKHTTSQ